MKSTIKSGLIQTLSVLAITFLAPACLDPLASDEIEPEGLVLPAGTAVPSAHDDAAIEKQLADNDGVDGVIPRISAFSRGERVYYWDFGAAPNFAAPLFYLAERNAMGELTPTAHKAIIDSIPGDPGYSPYWTVFFLETTEAYQEQLITSFAAIEEAQALGIVKPPVLADLAVNCPMTSWDVRLEVGGGNQPLEPVLSFYWEGQAISSYNLGVMPVSGATIVPESSLFVLRREGQEPLSEPDRGVDFTGDGDAQDTNSILSLDSPLCRRVDVVVPSDSLTLIDNSGDEVTSDLKSATDLFNPEPVVNTVIAFEETTTVLNCPTQSVEGAL